MADAHAEAKNLIRRTVTDRGLPERVEDPDALSVVAAVLARPSGLEGAA